MVNHECYFCGPALGLSSDCPACAIEAFPELPSRASRIIARANDGTIGVVSTTRAFLIPFSSPPSPHLATDLQSDLIWLEQSEPSALFGNGAVAPMAVALSPDGMSIVDQVFSANGQLFSAEDLGRVAPGSVEATAFASSLGRSGFTAVYSRATEQVFVLGGLDPSGEPARDVMVRRLDEPAWRTVPSGGYAAGKVLAATYSYGEGSLWILDEVAGSKPWVKLARLVLLDPTTGEGTILAEWPRLGFFNQHWLRADRDGSMLVFASSSLFNHHAIARVSTSNRSLEVLGLAFRPKALALPPVVDMDGYWLITRKAAKKLDVERIETLPLKKPEMARRHRYMLLTHSFALAVGTSSFVLGCACGSSGGESGGATPDAASDSPGESSAGGGSPGGGGATGGGGGSPDAAGGSCSNATAPGAPAGWVPFDAPAPCGCSVFVPGSPSAMPAPIAWEPCPPGIIGNPTCQRMASPWTNTTTLSISAFPRLYFDAVSGKAYLQFSRVFVNDNKSGARFRIVANVDGPVIDAFIDNAGQQDLDGPCGLVDQDLREGKSVRAVLPPAGSEPTEGVVAGSIGTPASVVFDQSIEEQTFTTWRVSSQWLLRWHTSLHVRPWNDTAETLVYDPGTDVENMPAHNVSAHGDAVFFEVGVAGYRGVMSWIPGAGLRPLLRWFGDTTQGAGNFATDGKDMVWTYGKNKPAGSSQEYPVRDIMTAPFTTDPDVVKTTAKRLRSDPDQMSPYPYGIGCGYAGRQFYSGTSNDGLLVRLSDGVSWIIDAPDSPPGDYQFLGVLGFTCEELFATFQFQDDAVSIIRIKLDSLGPGIPPD